MRISTSQYYSNSTDTMTSLQATIEKLQRQSSAGRTVLTPSDDPVGSARALDVSQSLAVTQQFATNRKNANSTMSITMSTLDAVVNTITDIKSQAINAGNAAYSDAERGNIATALKGDFQQLMGYANTTDGLGNYVFSGYKSSTTPFVDNGAAGVAYMGDQGVQTLQVDTTRTMNTTVSGQAVFQGKNGDIFNTVSNLMTVLNTPVTTDANNAEEQILVGKYNEQYGWTITGTSSPTVPTQAAIDAATAAATPAQLTAAQAAGQKARDDYSVKYDTRTDYPVGSMGALNQALAHAGGLITNALNNVSTVRAGMGANLNEMDNLDAEGTLKEIQYQDNINDLLGGSVEDQTSIISSLSQNQTALLTAQKVFSVTSNLSLLNYLK